MQSIYPDFVSLSVIHHSNHLTSLLNDVEPVDYSVVVSETINLSASCLFPVCLLSLSAVFCLGSIHPVVVNQSLALHSAANAALQNPGVCGLAPFKACLPTSAQTDTTNQAHSMREQAPHINNLLFCALNPKKKKKKGSTVCWTSPKTNSLD